MKQLIQCDIPKCGSSLREVKHLPRVQQPLEGLQETGSLVTATLGVDEDQERLLLLGECFHLR